MIGCSHDAPPIDVSTELRSCPEALPAPAPPRPPRTLASMNAAWNQAIPAYDGTARARKECDLRRAQAYSLLVDVCHRLQDTGGGRCTLPTDATSANRSMQ